VSDRIINIWDQLSAAANAGLIAVAVSREYTVGLFGRTSLYGYRVWRIPRDSNDQLFSKTSENGKNWRVRQSACEERAKQFASQRYGIKEWKRNARLDWVPAEIQKRWPIRRAK